VVVEGVSVDMSESRLEGYLSDSQSSIMEVESSSSGCRRYVEVVCMSAVSW